MIDWIVLHPIEAGIIFLPLAILYFLGVWLLERRFVKKPKAKSVGFYTPMDIAPGEAIS